MISEQDSIPVRELTPGSVVSAWRGTWVVLDPPLMQLIGRGARSNRVRLRVTDYYGPRYEVTLLPVTVDMELAALRAP